MANSVAYKQDTNNKINRKNSYFNKIITTDTLQTHLSNNNNPTKKTTTCNQPRHLLLSFISLSRLNAACAFLLASKNNHRAFSAALSG